MTTVILHGELGRLFGSRWRLSVSSLGEAIRAIDANVGGKLLHYLAKKGRGLAGYHVLFNGSDWKCKEHLYMDYPNLKSLEIMPAIAGAGGLSVWQILVGVILIAAAIAFPGTLAAGQTAFQGVLSGASGFVFALGTSLVLGGLAGLLAPTPEVKVGEKPVNQPSYVFNGAVNTYRQGNPVPVGYGMLLIGSQVVSAGMTSTDLPMVEKWSSKRAYVQGSVVFYDGRYYRARTDIQAGDVGKKPNLNPSLWEDDTTA